MDVPSEPMLFTKFSSSLAAPGASIVLTSSKVDWEVEMVAVIGKPGRNISPANALDYIGGYCVGQDVSDRELQFAYTPPQFSLAKSYKKFAPVGPWMTTADDVDPAKLDISCRNGAEVLQAGNTSQMIFDLRYRSVRSRGNSDAKSG